MEITLKYLGLTFHRSMWYKHNLDRNIIKCKRGLVELKTMVATNVEQRLLFVLFNRLVLSFIVYALEILTLSASQRERHENIGNASCCGLYA